MARTSPANRRVSLADEQTPLLASVTQDGVDETNHSSAEAIEHGDETLHGSNGNVSKRAVDDDEDKPLPMGQIFVLCISRVVDPISFFCIFPFVPKMVELMGTAEEDVGFYTGLIESLASVTQMFTMFLWGKAADKYGRKPVLVVSNLAVATFTTLFGTSRTLWQMILFRCLCGTFSGSVISLRTMFHEVSTPKTSARAFSYFAFAGNLGIFAGPAIGSLARPAEQYPDVFGNIQFFHDWPYILPTAIGGCVGFIAAFTAFFFLKETLPEHSINKKDDKPPMSTWELLKHKGVPSSILSFSWVGMLGFAFTAIAPVFFYTSVPRGGFGFSEKLISLFISMNGVAQALWLLFAFPPLHKRLGTRRLMQICGIFWGPFILFFPLNNWFLRRGWTAAFWAVAPLVQILGSGVAIGFICGQLAVNEASPSPELLGTLNGIALTIQPGVRAITPSLFSSIYAAGVKKHVLGGQLGMVLLAILAWGLYPVASQLKKPDGGQPPVRPHQDEESTDDAVHAAEPEHRN